MDLAEVSALDAPAGRALLASLPPYDDSAALALGERLRRDHPAALVAAALTQARLRARGRAKLGPDAERMLLTAAGLEQATRPVVAAGHARRFTAAGLSSVVDLGCGLGVDLAAFARAGLTVTGVDSDPVTCALAAANARALGLADRVSVECTDARGVDVAAYDGVWCDPARRSEAGRSTRTPADWSPPWSYVADLLTRHPAAGAKVAPGIPHVLVPPGVEAEWVSVAGDVVEAALWSGALASGVRRRATLLPAGATLTGSGAEPAPAVGPVGGYLYEPDGAVIRAGLVGAVAEQVGGTLVDPTIAYVTGPAWVSTPFAAAYEVLDALPFQLKRLRAALRAHGAGDVVVKKRGSALEPDRLRRQLALTGSGPTLTVVLTRVAGRPWALLARPAPE